MYCLRFAAVVVAVGPEGIFIPVSPIYPLVVIVSVNG